MDYKTVVYKANPIITASFSLTLNEQRLILACIAQIKNPNTPISPDDEFTIEAPYFSRLFGISSKNVYLELSEAATLLLSRVVTIEMPDPNNPSLSRTKTGWVSSADYYDKAGKVVIRFSEKMIPYISNLNGCFSRYKIEKIAKIKSVYAIRLYEVFVSEEWKGKLCEISLASLKNMFQLNGEYDRVYDFKKYVLDPSIKSINEHTDISVDYVSKKTGRTVTHFVFSIFRTEEFHDKLTDDFVQKNAKPGESWGNAKKRLKGK